jgi:hypothetical protein
MSDSIKVICDCGKDFDLYVAVQVEKSTKTESFVYPTIEVVEYLSNYAADDKIKVTYYSQGKLHVTSAEDVTKRVNEETLIKNMIEASNRIYEVTIEIFEHGETERIHELTSTYVNDNEIK